MENVHFLNLEYLLLSAYNFFFGISAVDVAVQEVRSPAQQALQTLSAVFWQAALLGMALTTVFLVLVVWVRVRIAIVEHEHHEHLQEEEEAAAQDAYEPTQTTRWGQIVALTDSPNESDWRRAILEADGMLADLLEEQGYRGDGVGEKLRDANPLQFTTLDLAWQAHKVRNNIAHSSGDFVLTQRDTKATIDFYRRVFEEFNFI